MAVQSPPSPTDQVQIMLGLLQGQVENYRRLKSLSEQQTVCIREGSTERLLSVLSLRQSVIEQLTRSNAELAPYRDRWDELSTGAAPDQRQQIRDAVVEIDGLLKQVAAQDELDRAELKSAQRQVGAQLSNISRAGRALHAYGPGKQPPKPATFTDRQG